MPEKVTPASVAAVKRARMVEALKADRGTYVAAGDTDRVRQIDASIEALGGKPVGRTARRGETA